VGKLMPLLLFGLVLSACGPSPSAASNAPGAPTVDHSYSAEVLRDAPAAYWRMGESSGTTMADASTNGNNGSYSSVALGQPGALTGDKATAVAFDGHTAGATVASSPSLQVKRITIELWIKKTTEAGYGVYLAKNFVSRGGVGSGWFQLLNNSYTGRLEFRVTGDTEPALVSSTPLALNSWYYVVATYDGAVANIYLNGTLDGSLPVVATPAQTDDPLFIARRPDGYYNNVVLEDLAIYPAALSADRITAHWHAATTMR
jgi:hypothetical protein